MRKLFYILVLFWCFPLLGQTQNVVNTYVDRCTGETKIVTAAFVNGSATVAFYNRVRTFTWAEYTNGTLKSWLDETYVWWANLSPCSTNTANNQSTQQTTSNATSNATNAANNATGTTNTGSSNTSNSNNTNTGNDTSNTGNSSSSSSSSSSNSTNNSSDSSSGDSGSSDSSGNGNDSSGDSSGGSEGNNGEEGGSSDDGNSGEGDSGENGEEGSGDDDNSSDDSSNEESSEENSESESEESESEESEESEEVEEEEESEEEESKEDSEEESEEEEEKKQRNPINVAANVLTQSGLDGTISNAMSIGLSQSSLTGRETYSANIMIWDNLRQFSLGLSQSNVYFNYDREEKLYLYNPETKKEDLYFGSIYHQGSIDFIQSFSANFMYIYGTKVASFGFSNVFMGQKDNFWKGFVGGYAFSGTVINIDNIVMIMPSSVIFGTKPFPTKKVTISPMLALSFNPISYSFDVRENLFKGDLTLNEHVTYIVGSNFDLNLSQRFTFNIGGNIIGTTLPGIPLTWSATIGSRFQF